MHSNKFFEDMSITEIWDFTRISERMKDFVVHELKVNNLELIIHIDDCISFEFVSATTNKKFGLFTAEPLAILDDGDTVFHQNVGKFDEVESAYLEPLNDSENDTPMIGTYWENYLEGGKALFKELDEVFRAPIRQVSLDLIRTGGSISPIVDWINEMGDKAWDPMNPEKVLIPEIIVGGICEYQRYMWLMDNLKPKGRMEFKFDPKVETSGVDLDVRISQGYWVRPSHFESWTKATKVTMLNSVMTPQEIKEVLDKIRQESFKQLAQVLIYFRDLFQFEEVLHDLNYTVDEMYRYHIHFDNGNDCIMRFTHLKNSCIDADGVDFVFEARKNVVESVQGTE